MPSSTLGLVAADKLVEHLFAYRGNGDISALPTELGAGRAEIELRCLRISDLLKANFGLESVLAQANHVELLLELG